MRDPYDVLRVSRTASESEIKSAYRAAAKRYHPDGNQNPEALARFQEVNAAYELLKDPVKRRRFDRGEIRADGSPRMRPQARSGGTAPPPPPPGRDSGFDSIWERLDAENMFSDLFRSRGARTAEPPGGGKRGEDITLALTLSFEEAALGGPKRVRHDGEALDLVLPPGLADGRRFRLKRQGRKGLHGGPNGDCIVDVTVKPHPHFRLQGRDILLDVPVSVPEAVFGAEITVPTVHGQVRLTVPPDSQGGTVLRLKGKGVPGHPAKGLPAGDQLVTLRILLPERVDAQAKTMIRQWAERAPYDPRKGRL